MRLQGPVHPERIVPQFFRRELRRLGHFSGIGQRRQTRQFPHFEVAQRDRSRRCARQSDDADRAHGSIHILNGILDEVPPVPAVAARPDLQRPQPGDDPHPLAGREVRRGILDDVVIGSVPIFRGKEDAQRQLLRLLLAEDRQVGERPTGRVREGNPRPGVSFIDAENNFVQARLGEAGEREAGLVAGIDGELRPSVGKRLRRERSRVVDGSPIHAGQRPLAAEDDGMWVLLGQRDRVAAMDRHPPQPALAFEQHLLRHSAARHGEQRDAAARQHEGLVLNLDVERPRRRTEERAAVGGEQTDPLRRVVLHVVARHTVRGPDVRLFRGVVAERDPFLAAPEKEFAGGGIEQRHAQ